jgi:hypothetical protein
VGSVKGILQPRHWPIGPAPPQLHYLVSLPVSHSEIFARPCRGGVVRGRRNQAHKGMVLPATNVKAPPNLIQYQNRQIPAKRTSLCSNFFFPSFQVTSASLQRSTAHHAYSNSPLIFLLNHNTFHSAEQRSIRHNSGRATVSLVATCGRHADPTSASYARNRGQSYTDAISRFV